MTKELVTKVSDDTFEQEVSSGVVVVEFFADWCGPCRMLAPVIEGVAEEMGDKVSFLKLDIDSNQKVAGQFHVTSVPTLVLFKDGKEVNRIVGLRDANAIKQFISTAT